MDRLFALVLHLQQHRRTQAQALAQAFEVSERTIYRDIVALNEAGVPIVSVPGQGYELMGGYYLPPLVFTAAEAAALMLGAHMLRAASADPTTHQVEGAIRKLTVALPSGTREAVERQTNLISFLPARAPFNPAHPHLQMIQTAIEGRRVLRVTYHSFSRDERSIRDVEPDRLWYDVNAWYLEGYCRWRGGLRAFRLDRMEALTIMDEHFVPRDLAAEAGVRLRATIRFTPSVVRWVLERQHPAFQTATQDPRGVAMTYDVETLNELLPWLRSWGADAEPVAPPELRHLVREEARRTLEQLT